MTRPSEPHRKNALRVLRALWRSATEPGYRDLLYLRLFKPKDWFQPFNDTKPNRYPVIFQFVQSALAVVAEPRLLSFGCSTGEELYSLRHYFPGAFIRGIDINRRNIAAVTARLAREPDSRISCAVANSTRGEASQSYDAIFCMAVLRDGRLNRPDIMSCAPFLRFEDVAELVEDFARCLKPGGLLIIRFSNFRLCDMPIGRKFTTILKVAVNKQSRSRLFGPDNRVLDTGPYPDAVFRKCV